ncbi:MAG: hemolysin family protein, partial [Stellaceae bacterium]
QGQIEEGEREMIDKVFVFGDKDVADVMVAKPDVSAVSIDMPPEEALAVVLDSPYTRYPVYRESLDDIAGVLHVRDLFSAIHDSGLAAVELEGLLRPAYVVPETKDLASLLQEFRKTNNHFAIVVDEYGALVGICTLEDLIEEIVGEIEDEYDVTAAPRLVERPDGTLIADARTPIAALEERQGTRLRPEGEQEEVDTLGGLVSSLAGRVPKRGEVITHPGGLEFEVLDADPRRIKRLRVRLPTEAAREAGHG